MKLERELGLKHGIQVKEHEALLNIYFTGDILRSAHVFSSKSME